MSDGPLLTYHTKAYFMQCPDCAFIASTSGVKPGWKAKEKVFEDENTPPAVRVSFERLRRYIDDHRAVAHAPEPIVLVS